MCDLTLRKIGAVHHSATGPSIVLEPEYTPALAGLDGFGHLQVLWWFSHTADDAARATLQEASPYKQGPTTLGTFATRSPLRPNPIALSCAQVAGLDAATGTIHLAYIDAEEGTPVLDIKPYTPSLDRVEAPTLPAWCRHWPASVETSGDFDWAAEFNF